jgi:hypothetical protein
LEQTREPVIVFAQGYYGILHLAEYSLLVGVQLQDRPPGSGTRQDVLAKYKLMTRHCGLCRNLRPYFFIRIAKTKNLVYYIDSSEILYNLKKFTCFVILGLRTPTA